jgi:dTDP-4-dehydrorhamnose reductase
MHKLLITGITSYLGRRLQEDLCSQFEVEGTAFSSNVGDVQKLDIRDQEAVNRLVGRVMPDYIVHAAALSSRGVCEKQPETAKSTNARGTQYVAQAASTIGAPVIFISSEAVTHDSVYGESKRLAEKLLKENAEQYLILRPGLIFGASPNTVSDRPHNRLLRAIEAKKGVFDNSTYSQPTWAGHLSAIIEQSIERNLFGLELSVGTPQASTAYEIARTLLAPCEVDVLAAGNEKRSFTAGDVSLLLAYDLPCYSHRQFVKLVAQELSAWESSPKVVRR